MLKMCGLHLFPFFLFLEHVDLGFRVLLPKVKEGVCVGGQNSWRSPWDCTGEEMNWEKPLRVHRRLSGPAASLSFTSLLPDEVSPESERLGAVQAGPLSSDCHCFLWLAFPSGQSQEGARRDLPQALSLPRTPSGGTMGGWARWRRPVCGAWHRAPTASPLVPVDARCGEGTRARRSHSPGLAWSALPLPSLL